MHKGGSVELSLNGWRGTGTPDGRKHGMILRVKDPTSDRTLAELEFSVEQLGNLMAGYTCNATVHFVPTGEKK